MIIPEAADSVMHATFRHNNCNGQEQDQFFPSTLTLWILFSKRLLYSEGRLGPLWTILDFYPVRKDLVYLLLHTVVSFKSLGAEPSHYMDESSLVDLMEVRHSFTVPCGNIMPCGFDDRPSFLVFVGVIGSNGESDVLIIADSLEFDVSNVSSQFDFVDLFHILYWF